MMSQKALLFGDLLSYRKIMNTVDPKECKAYGKDVTPFEGNLILEPEKWPWQNLLGKTLMEVRQELLGEYGDKA